MEGLGTRSCQSEGGITTHGRRHRCLNIPISRVENRSGELKIIRTGTYRITVSQSPVKALENEDADAFASSISRTTVVEGVTFSVLIQERAIVTWPQ